MQLYIFFSANYFPHKNYTVRNEHITIPAHTHIAIVSLINRHKTSNILPGGKIKKSMSAGELSMITTTSMNVTAIRISKNSKFKTRSHPKKKMYYLVYLCQILVTVS